LWTAMSIEPEDVASITGARRRRPWGPTQRDLRDYRHTMSPKKILTRLELGGVEIAHRAVLDAPRDPTRPGLYRRLATPGGLVITSPIAVMPPVWTATSRPGGLLEPACRDAWRAAVGAVHDEGGRLIARLCCPTGPAPGTGTTGAPTDAIWPEEVLRTCEAAATAARELGFDGVELCVVESGPILLPALQGPRDPCEGDTAERSCGLAVEILQGVIDAWGSDRVGLRLSLALVSRQAGAFDLVCALLAMLNEMEIAFLHLADLELLRLTGGTRTAAATRVRQAFRWPMMASGPFSVRDAVALVDSRWADAVCFPGEADGRALLGRLAAFDG
jgi:2,4-dienoyl-CoA reductase-like NADH-dependent reductase (Old Yellow Enzyme family)